MIHLAAWKLWTYLARLLGAPYPRALTPSLDLQNMGGGGGDVRSWRNCRTRKIEKGWSLENCH